MEIIDISAGIGGFLLGAMKVGLRPVMAIEKARPAIGCLKRNFKFPILHQLPTINEIPRCEALVGHSSGITEELLKAIPIILPRFIAIEVPDRGRKPQIEGYTTWYDHFNFSEWIPVNRRIAYAVLIRKDINLKTFVFPERTNFSKDNPLIDRRGRTVCKDFVQRLGYPETYDLSKVGPRRIARSTSPIIAATMLQEVYEWTRI
jgi:hypothetical protein